MQLIIDSQIKFDKALAKGDFAKATYVRLSNLPLVVVVFDFLR